MGQLLNILQLPKAPGSIATPKRTSCIQVAIDWPGGTLENKVYRTTYVSGEFRIALGKPGKEASPDFKKQNLFDMTPTVFFRNSQLDFFPTFGDIFRDFWHLGKEVVQDGAASERVFELVGALLYRSSYMLDHCSNLESDVETSNPEYSQPWVWVPPTSSLEGIHEHLTHMGRTFTISSGENIRLPIDVYLHLVEALALNEDVKYQSENVHWSGKVKGGAGRVNTLQTCASMIGVYLDRYDVVTLFDKLSRSRGVAPMSQKDAKEVFPSLR